MQFAPSRVTLQAVTDRDRKETTGNDGQLLAHFSRSIRRTRLRMRGASALDFLSKNAPTAVLFFSLLAIFYRFRIISVEYLLLGSTCAIFYLLVGAMYLAQQGPSLLKATLRLDSHHHLKGRFAAAWAFGGKEGQEAHRAPSSAFIALILQEAHSLGALSPRKAAPLDLPSGLKTALLMLISSSLFFAIPLPPLAIEPLPTQLEQTATTKQWLSLDDADLLQDAAKELILEITSEAGQKIAKDFQEIVQKARQGEVNQEDAFRLVSKLKSDLDGAALHARELREGLSQRGEALKKHKLTREIGKALQEGRYKDAEAAMKRLAERLRTDRAPLSKKELDELRASLDELRNITHERSSANKKTQDLNDDSEINSLEEQRQRLLKKKKAGTSTPQDARNLEKTERRLKRLSRTRKAKSKAAQETLSELDKQLAQAAKDLQKERKKSGQFLDQASQTLKQGTQKILTDKEKRELLKQIKALKEKLRRQNKDGKHAQRLKEFQKRARQARKKAGQARKKSSQSGAGQKKGAGSTQVQLGPNGQALPQSGNAEGSGTKPGQGKKPGQEHNPDTAGESSSLKNSKVEDKNAVAQDTGEGESASETITSVAEEGFVSGAYGRLYHEYHTVAEEVMDKEKVPPGRKAHVLRYFELIRPRYGSESSQGKK